MGGGCRYIVSSDGAGGVAGDELELYVDLAEEVLGFGAEAGAGGLVEGEGEEVAVVEYGGAATAPGYIDVLVEVSEGKGCRHEAQGNN